MWNQRSRALWIKCGDRNTKVFHAMASQRRRNNKIDELWDKDGAWKEDQSEVEGIILEYFANIFKTNYPANVEVFLDAVEARVTREMNEELISDLREEEVRCALNQMHPTKSPCPDGMSPIFFQKYWDIVRPDVINYVLHSLNSSVLPRNLNDTYICLIPKVNCPQKITEFRPISLCNVLYKIIAKVLAN